jgi:cephalosporin hydroxylase
MVAMQEHTWKIKPDLIIEAGIARGGSITLSLSMLALLDMCDAIESGEKLDPKISHRKVLGDIIAQVQTTAKQHGLAWVQ